MQHSRRQMVAHQKRTSEERDVANVVREGLAGGGRPLDAAVAGPLSGAFAYDLTKVRIHDDLPAARSALALGAGAYTIGNHIAFAPGTFAPHSPAGRKLLAHELFHVRSSDRDVPAGNLRVSSPTEMHEREASESVSRISSGRPVSSRRDPARGVVYRTLLGAIAGGIGGALAGAAAGFLIGGPIGAIVGGVAGLAAGTAIGEAATTKSRHLTSAEKAYAHDIFADSIDYDVITVTRDSALAVGAPRTFGNTIGLKSSWNHFKGDTLDLTDTGNPGDGMHTLIHEMCHVWQYQNGGLAYLPESLIAQISAVIKTGDRDAAYDWKSQHKAKVPWKSWNPEQQAAAAEDYNTLLRKNKSNPAAMTTDEISQLAILSTYMKEVWQRRGAPGSSDDAKSSTSGVLEQKYRSGGGSQA